MPPCRQAGMLHGSKRAIPLLRLCGVKVLPGTFAPALGWVEGQTSRGHCHGLWDHGSGQDASAGACQAAGMSFALLNGESKQASPPVALHAVPNRFSSVL